MIMAKNYFNIILLSIFLLIGCNTKQNKLDYEHLAVLDTLLQSTPEKVCDSLKGIDIKKQIPVKGYTRQYSIIK